MNPACPTEKLAHVAVHEIEADAEDDVDPDRHQDDLGVAVEDRPEFGKKREREAEREQTGENPAVAREVGEERAHDFLTRRREGAKFLISLSSSRLRVFA